ncbi:MAG: hypothetical protein PVJ49_21275 [Acidobacteriota bacterium]
MNADPSLRRFLLAILTVGVIGTLTELGLLEHYEEAWQLVPVTLLSLSIPVIAWCWMRPSPAALRVLQVLMTLFVVGGLIGVYQHYSGNVEFELEMYPSRAGSELFWQAIKGATPALAPASLSWLGLLGLAFTFHHSLLRK